MLTVREIW